MMSNAKKWIACLTAVLLVFQAAPALMDEGVYVSNVTEGSLAGFRDAMEIISENGAFMLEGESMVLTTNEDYTPVWSSSNADAVTIAEGSSPAHSVTIRAMGIGEAVITAKDGDQSKTFSVTVLNPEVYEEQDEAENPEQTEGGEEGTEPEAETAQKMVIVVNGGTELIHYNGEEQTFGEYTATSNNAAFDASKVRLNRDIAVTAKDCGYYMMNLQPADFSYDDSGVRAIFVVNDGYMKINPAKVTVQADNQTKEAGQEDPELTATVTGLIGEDQIEYTLERDPGEKPDFYRITATGESTQGNYRVQYISGLLEITGEYVEDEEGKEKTPMSIRVISDWPKGQVGYPGAKITLTAELTGFEGIDYILQWQYSTDYVNWVDQPGANGMTFTYELDETTTQYTWRVVARTAQ
ncbi:MAG: hypothetical protein E7325_09075 [Clostridiales bacterium]|nr:hypothetical protein [Clostridiales bacterium]